MGPPTGPRAGTSAGATRGRGIARGGGIQKRRAAPAGRVDRDGDISMDGPKSGGGDASRGRKPPSGPSRGARRTAQNVMVYGSKDFSTDSGRGGRVSLNPSKARFAHTAVLKVTGLGMSAPDRNLATILTFLERKASKNQSKQITINKSVVEGDDIFLQVSKDDVPNFLHLDGFTYGPSAMSIAESDQPWPQRSSHKSQLTQEAAETKEKLKGVLFRRYDTPNRILNLSALGKDQTLVAMGLFEARNTAEKAFKALMHITDQQFTTAKAKAEAIQGVSLASNELGTVAPVFDLAETFPELKMLDLSNNKIEHMRQLTRWRGRFKKLEHIVLTGNPIETQEPNYKNDVMEWFPRLLVLNGQQVRTAEQVAAREAASLPRPIPQAGPDFRDSDGVGEGFLRTFFPMYDTDRSSLLASFYDEESRFTLSIVNNTFLAAAPVPSWQPYLKFSRNMVRITTEAARSQRLFEGGATIADLWKQLPATRHPDLLDHAKYIIDCHPIPGVPDPTRQSLGGVGGLLLTVHGQFQEMEKDTQKTGMRSFSRTVVLGPGRPGRNAIRVISDMLVLRAFSPVPAFTVAVGINVQEQRKRMVLELTNRTKMTPEYSEMCLEGVQWDFENALIAFEAKRAELPHEAFIAA